MSLNDLYRRVIMDHAQSPRNRGTIENGAVSVEMNNPSCGDRISLQLQVKDDTIEDARFIGEGCSISLASASMMTEAVKGLKVEEAVRLSQLFSDMMQGGEVDFEEFPLEDIEALRGVAKFPARIKCATMAWKALEQGARQTK